MRVVITGASGNVGTALLRVLPAEHEVVGWCAGPRRSRAFTSGPIGARST